MSGARPQPLIAVAYHLAIDRKFNRSQTLALIALAEHAWKGVATLSLPEFAQLAVQSRKEVWLSVHFLASKEGGRLVQIVSRKGLPTEYRLCFGSYVDSEERPEPLPQSQGLESEPVPNGHDTSVSLTLPEAVDQCHGDTTTSVSLTPPLYPLRVPLSKEERTFLRKAQPAPPPDAPRPKAVEILFSEGLQAVRDLTGRPERGCRSLIGGWKKQVGDDSAQVLDAIRRAADVCPADPVAFIGGCLRKPDNSMAAIEARLLAAIDAREVA